MSAPEVVLAAIAGRTKRILLGSAVTVLSTDDPVRVFQRFSTLDALSNGRAEVILGRGSFTESYPLFGYDLSDYNELFKDKLRLFAELLKPGAVTWSGSTRPTLRARSSIRQSRRDAAHLGRRGRQSRVGRPRRALWPAADARDHRRQPAALQPFVDLYHQSLQQLGQPERPIAVHSPGHVAATDELAKEQLWPHYQAMMTRIGRERGWPPVTRAQFEREAGPEARSASGRPRPWPRRSPGR